MILPASEARGEGDHAKHGGEVAGEESGDKRESVQACAPTPCIWTEWHLFI